MNISKTSLKGILNVKETKTKGAFFMIRNFLSLIVILGLFTFIIVGCATIIKGTKQDIYIKSDPPNAEVIITTTGGVEVWKGVTPASVKLAKKKEYVVTIRMSGYKDATVQITQSFEPWALANLVCTGIVGLVVDAVDGAMWKLEPDQIMVTLSTALLENGETQLYAVLYALDDKGQLRSLAIPMIRDTKLVSTK